MATTISKYFTEKVGIKRKTLSSSSSASDLSVSPEPVKINQDKKKYRPGSENNIDEEMALQETLCELKATMTKLSTKEDVQSVQEKMATKDDIRSLREEMDKLTTSLMIRIEKLEGSVFELENEKDKLKAEVTKLRGEKAEFQGQLAQSTKETRNMRSDLNDQEQHGRQWNLRIFGIQEAQGENAEDCVKKCVDIFSQKLTVPVSAADVEIAHRSGKVAGVGGRPRPILIRFHSRRQRRLVLSTRRKLKQTGVSIGEDLTQANYRLLRKVTNHSAIMAAWSSNGKILAKLKNGKTVKVDVNVDIDSLFAKEMA